MEQVLNLFTRYKNPDGIVKPISHSFVFRVLGLLLIYLSQVLLARLMGPKAYGDYTVIITIVNVLLAISLFGMDTSALRFIPSAIAKKENGAVHGFIRFSYRLITFISIICSIGLFVFLLANAKKFNIGFSEGLFWAVLLLPFLAFIYQAGSVLRALQQIKISMLPVYILLPIFISAGCLYYYTSNHKLSVDAAMMINLICTVAVCIFINKKAGRTVSQLVPEADGISRPGLWTSVSALIFITTLLNMLLKQSDILFISYFLGNTKAGIYGAAVKISTLVALGLSVTDYVFMPKIAALWEKRQVIRLQKLVHEGSRQILLITIPIAIVLFAGGKLLLGFFGESFSAAYLPLVILIIGQLVNAVTGMVGGLLTMTGNQKMFLVFYLAAFGVQSVLNIILIPAFGILGASIASSLGLILLNVIGYRFIKKRMKISASAF
ncbi:MAG TPA: polysaccharide biosynthesis C-terminal domain-containing protein [Bacteroidia bacterium]|nr:polysaccharide biosynthesis C-terminal domain-containing protein [Bacteroidia bacterium]